MFLKERAPYTESHFAMGSPSMNCSELSVSAKSCGMEMYNVNVLPSSMSSASIVSLDTDQSDAISTSSDGDHSILDEAYPYSDSIDFLADLLDITPVM
jgi:hypothetical protein